MSHVKMEMVDDGLKRGERSEVKSENSVIYIKIVGILYIDEIMQKYHIRREK